MARTVVEPQQSLLWGEVVERVFPDPDLLLSLDEEDRPRQARVLSFRESDPEGVSSCPREREEACAR